MVLDSRMTWEKIKLELELLNKEEPQSLLPLLIGINSLLRGDNFQDWCSRKLSFMTFELCSNHNEKSESERLEALNDFFFENQDYGICQSQRQKLNDRDLFIRDVLSDRTGGALPLALIYMHLAYELKLPMVLVNLESLSMVRWLGQDTSVYIDLSSNGRRLNEEEMLSCLGRKSAIKNSPANADTLAALDFKQTMTLYLEDLAACLARGNEPDLVHAVLSMLLALHPSDLKYLADRALLRKSLGFQKEALSDIKRYFSFCDIENAPTDIQAAFKEMTAFQSLDAPEILH